MERLSDKLREYLKPAQGRTVDLKDIRAALKIEVGSKDDTNLKVQMSGFLTEKKVVRPSGKRDGVYFVIRPVEPVKWWEGRSGEPINFLFPRSREDNTEFGIEDLVEIFMGDFILITGVTNFGKTAVAINVLGENLHLFPTQPRLMGSEYTASDGKISPKFGRRMRRMNWVEWVKDGQPQFELYPVGSDYQDYVKSDTLNIIDWISLPNEYFLIDSVTKAIKDEVGDGILVAVTQKNTATEWSEGGERAERYADLVLKIDPYGNESRLTIGKVKASKGRATGRMWAFDIVDYGANLHNIREIVKCSKCWGKGYIRSGQNNIRCDVCLGKKYVDKQGG
jgi:hypothetical protein